MEGVTREFASDLLQLPAMRAFVREVCNRAWGPGGEEAPARLELALDEAAANIMLHAYRGPRPVQPAHRSRRLHKAGRSS